MSSKVRIDLEFPIHASPSFLYQYISTPDSMGEWFADNVNSRGKKFIFIWDDSEEVLLFLDLSLFFGVNPALRTFLVTIALRLFS